MYGLGCAKHKARRRGVADLVFVLQLENTTQFLHIFKNKIYLHNPTWIYKTTIYLIKDISGHLEVLGISCTKGGYGKESLILVLLKHFLASTILSITKGQEKSWGSAVCLEFFWQDGVDWTL